MFILPEADFHSASTETLWATPLGKDMYQLDNTPFYAEGFSFKDVVLAPFDDTEGFPVVKNSVKKSGHSTYLIWVPSGIKDNPDFDVYWNPLENLGCSFEGIDGKMIAVDIPATTDIHTAYGLMDSGLENDIWDFKEQDVSHPL